MINGFIYYSGRIILLRLITGYSFVGELIIHYRLAARFTPFAKSEHHSRSAERPLFFDPQFSTGSVTLQITQ